MADLFYSEDIEGSSNNEILEIYNGTEAAINPAVGYVVQMCFKGSTTIVRITNLNAGLTDSDTLAQRSANTTILAQAAQISSASWFNDDDAMSAPQGRSICC